MPPTKPLLPLTLTKATDHHQGDSKIDRETLKDLVKNKNQEKLESLGGPNGLVSALNTNTRLGINDEANEIQRRHATFGSNTYTRPPSKGLIYFVVEAFKNLTARIYLGCATLSLVFGIKEHGLKEGWYDGVSLLVAVFLMVAVSAASNFRKKREIDKVFKVTSDIKINVVRNGGRPKEISIFDIVVGDIICLNIGDQVPADGVLVEGHSLHIDESSLTGESDLKEKSLKGNTFLFSGTKVADGLGKMVVTSFGMNTDESSFTNEETPLQSRLNKLTSVISQVVLLVAFLVLLVRYFTESTNDEKMVPATVAIIIVGLPEGSPLAVTLTWAYSMKRMMKGQVVPRKLSACETMGSVTAICTDKTGTMTLNQMEVTDYCFGLESGTTSSYSPSEKVVGLFYQGTALNTRGRVFKANSGSEYEFSGSPMEKALLRWGVEKLKMDTEKVVGGHDVVHMEAFDSEKQRSGVLMKKKGETTEKNVVHWKGDAEKILGMCSTFYDASGVMREIDEGVKNKFEDIIKSMAAESLELLESRIRVERE